VIFFPYRANVYRGQVSEGKKKEKKVPGERNRIGCISL